MVDNGNNPLYATSGHVLFFRDGTLLAAPFDAAQLQVTGPAVSVLREISLDQFGAPLVAISSAGTLAYIPSGQAAKRLVWVSRQGVEQPITDVRRRGRTIFAERPMVGLRIERVGPVRGLCAAIPWA